MVHSLVVRADKADIIILLNIIDWPLMHYHTFGAVRGARATSISNIVLSTLVQPSTVRVVTVYTVMVEAGSQIIAQRHSTGFNLPWGLVISSLGLIFEISWAFVALILLLVFVFVTLLLLRVVRTVSLLFVLIFL